MATGLHCEPSALDAWGLDTWGVPCENACAWCFGGPTKVLTDWVQGLQPRIDKACLAAVNEGTEPHVTDIQSYLAAFVEDERDKKDQRKRKALDSSGGLQRMHNRALLGSLDHQLQRGCGVNLQTFVSAHPLKPLGVDEERYLAEIASPASSEPEARSCIHNRRTGERRIELPLRYVDGSPHLPTIHICMDQGPVGWPAMQFYAFHCKAHATLHFDHLHRMHNDWKDGLQRQASLCVA